MHVLFEGVFLNAMHRWPFDVNNSKELCYTASWKRISDKYHIMNNLESVLGGALHNTYLAHIIVSDQKVTELFTWAMHNSATASVSWYTVYPINIHTVLIWFVLFCLYRMLLVNSCYLLTHSGLLDPHGCTVLYIRNAQNPGSRFNIR